jgi:glycosyltransferase involved in cell wall biosynthesis
LSASTQEIGGRKIVVVIPAFNESESIGRVIDEAKEALEGLNFTIVVVDGRSTDGTDKIAREKGAILIYQRKTGYGDALRTGFIHARRKLGADILAMMDGDMTYDPADIPRMLLPIVNDEADVVVGNRLWKEDDLSMTLLNRVGNRVLSSIARITLGVDLHDTQCGIRAFKAELVDSIDLTAEGMPFATEMLAELEFAGARMLEMNVSYRPRSGKTKLHPLRDGFRILATIVRLVRDTRPLLFFAGAGSVLGIAGLLLGVEVTINWFRTHDLSLLPTVMLSAFLLIGAMQFTTLGLVADMVKRLKRKPY